MSDMQGQAPAPAATLPNRQSVADLSGLQATNALLRAVEMCATKAQGDDRAAEVKDYGAAALAFAQAIITLDPTRLAGGDTPAARAASQPPQQPAQGPAGRPPLPPTKDGNRDGVIGG